MTKQRSSLRCAIALVAISTTCFATLPATAQMANGKSKFVGNVIAGSVPSSYGTYWNQVTPENGTKWGAVEGTRNSMNWTAADTAYNYAQSKGYKFKFHTLVWGSQAPSWISSLSTSTQRAEIEQWMSLACQRYPNSWAVDVVNEPLHAPPSFKAALGGDGSTGWDWVITSYRLARQYCPKAKLFINEYGTENDSSARSKFKNIVQLLKNNGLVDGIGLQSHYFNLDNMSGSQMKSTLDDYASLGVDIYISELDITGGGSESGQKSKYQDLFPVMWTHASVKGITLWGYVVGQTWADGTGLYNSNGSERSALTWLKGYVAGSATSSSSSSKASSSSSSKASSSSSSSKASSSSSSASGTPVLSGTGDYPTGFSKCADEGATCAVTKGTGWVAFGRKGKWVAKNVGVGKSIACTTSAFGSDPGGNPNKCSYQQ